MTEELYDIVNKNDEVIGQATYEDVRDKNLAIRVVHNWILNKEGKILLQFRGEHKKSKPRHFDASVGGRVDAGETYEQAVIRETKEEMGIETNPKWIGKVFMDEPKEEKFISVFISKYDGEVSGWEEEAEAIEWFTKDELENMYKRFPYLFCGYQSIECLLQYLGKNA